MREINRILKKRLVWAILLLVLVSNGTIPNYAGSDEMFDEGIVKVSGIQLKFVNISIFQNVIDISDNGKVSIKSNLSSRNVNSVEIEACLQQLRNGSWVTMKKWSNISIGSNLELEGNCYVVKGYEYRLVSTGKVVNKNFEMEQTIFISDSKYY
ncbi:hypothetical protein [Fusibacter sp. 3D3]|uniref:hypothetical protein n=1 Tax=Fusibacter sp. 3D3 TaxID=1048380 RepID=UPI001112D1E8|nr:hypothetical protein [Fusibacter sp. 3D3]